MKIIRIFPKRTNMTPIDNYSFIGSPGLFIPEHDEVHISVTFIWDIKRGYELLHEWESVTDRSVKIGGPAISTGIQNFVPGMYIKNGVTITSRGCPNNCKYCFVPGREGKINELEIKTGNIVQDNNILACSDKHIKKVFNMLKTQHGIEFKGGLEPSRITENIAENLRGLKIKSLWLACDTKNQIKALSKAVKILQSAGFKRNHLRCYVLIGDSFQENLNRLIEVYKIGCLPFAQLYQPKEWIDYPQDWKDFCRTWSRPAAYKSYMNQNGFLK
jgi:hypothetical protein